MSSIKTRWQLEQWLDRSIFRAADYGTDDAWVVIYGFTSELEEILSMSPRWNEVQLHSLRTLQEVRSGEVLPVEIQVSRYSSDNLKLSLRLVGPDGTIVSSQDRFVTEVIRFGLFAPPESQPGEYRIVAILYDGTTMVNIPAISDFIENSVEVSLATVQIVRP
ncbi:hypothetical protein [Caldilinea sp.]|uniref:hypothetical protein n=1 Tax=Caldilinea sp. TaxID=2293560 RepID=UPI0026087AE9|nr:hypothetical protein [Caldilinea sp.]